MVPPKGTAISIISTTKDALRPLVRWTRRIPGRAGMALGRVGSLSPLSSCYGFDRGTPVDRPYIEAFLERHSADIKGRVLEVGDDAYSRRFGGDRISRQDVLHVHAGNPAATIVGDLVDEMALPENSFDCIILTQTLQYVFDLETAIRNVRRALKPGGIALITVPAIIPMCDEEWSDRHYWLFTTRSVQRLLTDAFDADKVDIVSYGNLYSATAFLHGAAIEELNRRKLGRIDHRYPVTIAARAVA